MRSAEESAVIDLKERFDGVWTADIEEKFSEKVQVLKEAFRKREGKRLAAVEKAEGEFRRFGTDDDRWNRDSSAFAEAFPDADPWFWSEKWKKCRGVKEREAVHGALLYHWRVEVQRRLDAELERELKEKIAASNKGLAELCRRIGRQVGRASERKEKPVEEDRDGWLKMRTDAMREELSGIRVGQSIEDALPSELAACGDEDIGTLFDLKFIEGQMLCFEKTGEDRQRITERKKIMRKVDETQGPVIICVDTSASMQGEPEVAAKAVALTLALQTRRENRKCHIIEFSTGVREMDVGAGTDIHELMKFLSESFSGGTNANRALEAGIRQMEQDGFRKADLLMVSDMEFGDQPGRMMVRMNLQRKKGSRFYALQIQKSFSGIFGVWLGQHSNVAEEVKNYDKAWMYDPSSGKIKELKRHEVQDEAQKKMES